MLQHELCTVVFTFVAYSFFFIVYFCIMLRSFAANKDVKRFLNICFNKHFQAVLIPDSFFGSQSPHFFKVTRTMKNLLT